MGADDNHFERLTTYFEKSKLVYDLLLRGAKHLGFYPNDSKISEEQAQLMMQDLIAKKLELSDSMRVLDAGCGEGIVSTYLSISYKCRIEGITVVPFETRRAKRLAEKLGVTNRVGYFLMDYSNTAFKDACFDAIYTIESLVHSTNIRRTLNEFYRVLKPKGKIALFEYSLANDNELTRYERDIINKVSYSSAMASFKYFRNNRIQEMLRSSGFNEIDTIDITNNVAPSVYRVKRYFNLPYSIVKLLRLQQNFPNLTGVIEFSKLGEKDLMKYKIISAQK